MGQKKIDPATVIAEIIYRLKLNQEPVVPGPVLTTIVECLVEAVNEATTEGGKG